MSNKKTTESAGPISVPQLSKPDMSVLLKANYPQGYILITVHEDLENLDVVSGQKTIAVASILEELARIMKAELAREQAATPNP